MRAYIEALEAELARTQGQSSESAEAEPPVWSEPPTTLNVVSISESGLAKRTPRHHYGRQRRGGMGVFDLITPEDDPPTFLAVADAAESLVLITSEARAFRLPVERIAETAVNGRGRPLSEAISLFPAEKLAVVLSDRQGLYAAVLSERGYVRWLVGHLLGERLRPGTVLYDAAKFGRPVAGCWAPSNSELLVATRFGRGVRFSSRQLPLQSCALGIRPEPGDSAAGIAAVPGDDSQILLMTADGKGTIYLMSGFRANKSLGIAGKTAIKTDGLIGVLNISQDDDVFVISRLGKIIRFPVNEIPAKAAPVQGVNCMALRADECTAVAASQAN